MFAYPDRLDPESVSHSIDIIRNGEPFGADLPVFGNHLWEIQGVCQRVLIGNPVHGASATTAAAAASDVSDEDLDYLNKSLAGLVAQGEPQRPAAADGAAAAAFGAPDPVKIFAFIQAVMALIQQLRDLRSKPE